MMRHDPRNLTMNEALLAALPQIMLVIVCAAFIGFTMLVLL